MSTIDLHGTTQTIAGNLDDSTRDVISAGTLVITGTVSGSTVNSFFNNVTIGGMDNGSTLSVDAGTLDVIGTASGGAITITDGVGIIGGNVNGVSVDLNTSHFINLGPGVTANGDVFDYVSGISTIELQAVGNGNLFENLNDGDHIELATPFNSASLSANQHTITLFENGQEVTSLDVTFAPSSHTDFFVGVDKNTGLSFIQVIPCFAAGTRIMTARGEVQVEELRQGDLVVTLSGKGSPLKRVRWIGERRIDIAGHPQPDLVRPVRIKAGALADGMPLRDLVVSPDHAVAVDGVLMNAGKLLNGVSIVQDLTATSVQYFHVELSQHDILLADGMPAESYLDTGNSNQFTNAARLVVLHPDFAPKRMQTDACLPFVEDGPVLAVRAPAADRAAASRRQYGQPRGRPDARGEGPGAPAERGGRRGLLLRAARGRGRGATGLAHRFPERHLPRGRGLPSPRRVRERADVAPPRRRANADRAGRSAAEGLPPPREQRQRILALDRRRGDPARSVARWWRDAGGPAAVAGHLLDRAGDGGIHPRQRLIRTFTA